MQEEVRALLQFFGVYSPSSDTLVHRRCINGSALSLAGAVLTATVLILALVQLLAVLSLVTLPPLLLAVSRHTETLLWLVSVNVLFSFLPPVNYDAYLQAQSLYPPLSHSFLASGSAQSEGWSPTTSHLPRLQTHVASAIISRHAAQSGLKVQEPLF